MTETENENDRQWLRELFVGSQDRLVALPEWARPVLTPPLGEDA